MREIEKQQETLPTVTVKIGEGLNNLNETIDNILGLLLVEDSSKGTPEEKAFKKFFTMAPCSGMNDRKKAGIVSFIKLMLKFLAPMMPKLMPN